MVSSFQATRVRRPSKTAAPLTAGAITSGVAGIALIRRDQSKAVTVDIAAVNRATMRDVEARVAQIQMPANWNLVLVFGQDQWVLRLGPGRSRRLRETLGNMRSFASVRVESSPG